MFLCQGTEDYLVCVCAMALITIMCICARALRTTLCVFVSVH